MQAYRIIDKGDDDIKPVYRKTQALAHATAKERSPDARPDLRIQLVEISNAADPVISYLNGGQPLNPEVLKTWRLSNRGALVELNADGTDVGASE